ncbi:MAG: ferritin-like domain-containing protein [Phycisphaerales bacterium]
MLTLTDAVERSTLDEVSPSDWKPDRMVEGAIEGLSVLLESLHTAADIADDQGDRGTVALMEDLIQQYEKRRWMFNAYLGSNPAG